MDAQKACENCRFVRREDRIFRCGRHAPTAPMADAYEHARWPMVWPNDWCGDYEPEERA